MAVAPGAEKSNSSFGPQSNTGWTEVRQSKHRIPPGPDGTSWALVLFFSFRNTARWHKGPQDRRYTAFCRRAEDVRMDHLSQACLKLVKLLSSLHLTPPSAHSAHWLPSRRIASIAIIAQYPLPHCHDYGLALSCLALPCLALAWPVW
jgi:hypothetical protein